MLKFELKNTVYQSFSLPFPIISYFCKESRPTHEVLSKLYNSCKYFWPQIKVFPVNELWIDKEIKCISGENPFLKYEILPEAIANYEFKLFIFDGFHIETPLDEISHLCSSLLAVCRFEVQYFWLVNQRLTWREYKMLSKCAVDVDLRNTKIFGRDMSIIPLDELIMSGPEFGNFTM